MSFNEAAGIPRGRRAANVNEIVSARGFNEAAGIPRGRHQPAGPCNASNCKASMRPRVFPAEDDGAPVATVVDCAGLQ